MSEADSDLARLSELKLEHEATSTTPEVQDLLSQENVASGSGSGAASPSAASASTPAEGSSATAEKPFIFGAATRLGGRILTPDRDPWTHNAWDNVEWDAEQEEAALKAIERQEQSPISPEEQAKLNETPAKYWDYFYLNVEDKFFKDRAWLCQEFDALADAIKPGAGPQRIAEIGCGTGATAYPLLALNQNPELFIHCLDYSRQAVSLVQRNPAYDPARIEGRVWSVCDPAGLPESIAPGSVDTVVCIFVLSALHPDEWEQAMKNIWDMLRPGGTVCFRDYGRNDLTQLRFKGSRFMQPNLYARGDKTRVYFFTKDELAEMFSPSSENAEHRFETINLGVDRRLLMNRKRQLKMYRIWMQGIFRKPGGEAVQSGTADDSAASAEKVQA